MQISRQSRVRRLINLTPLVDVVFLLLIFFMLASSFLDIRQVSISVLRPGAPIGTIDDDVRIRIGTGTILTLNGKPADLKMIEAWVRLRLRLKPGQRIDVVPDTKVPLQRVVDVLDRLRASGAKSIALERPVAPIK